MTQHSGTFNGVTVQYTARAGESFGTTQAAAVTDLLESRRGISLNGIIMISQALDYAGSTPVDDNLVSYIT